MEIEKLKKNKRGITLIALVVTIVVLLILAGVSISMLTGENGIITQAKEAKDKTIIGDEKESISIAYLGCKQKNLFNGNITDEELQEELNSNGKSTTVTIADSEYNLQIVFNETNHRYTISQEGNIEKIKDLTKKEANKIVDLVAYNEEKIYVLTLNGEVREAKIIIGNIFSKLELTDNIITKNGVKEKGKNYFIDNNGKIYTWGYNNKYGQLGNGTTENSSMPICISDIEGNALNGKKITDVYKGGETVIAKDSEGKIYTWGNNYYGQLGNGTTENSSEPICINDIEENVLNGKNIVDIILGDTVIAKDNNGKIYTWGYNGNGQLGNGTTENSSEPICISDIEKSELLNKKITKFKKYNVGGMYLEYYLTDDGFAYLYFWHEIR